MDKKTLIAMGTGLALSLTSTIALASSDASMQAHEMNSGYSNSDHAKVGKGQCGANKQNNMKNAACTKSQNCSDNAKSKASSGKCGSGKCGSGKCAAGKCAGSDK